MSREHDAGVASRTIADFGQQWTTYTDNDGYYGSDELFDDVFYPFLTIADLKSARIAEIGAGSGRWVQIFLRCAARHVTAVEPSRAIDVLRSTFGGSDRVTLIHGVGEDLPSTPEQDFVFSIGVLHHIPDPAPACRAAYRALRPGGTFGLWVYGREGNGAYLALFGALHLLTRRLPHPWLAGLTYVLQWGLAAYIRACRYIRLPLHDYMVKVIGRVTADKQRLIIYDQLNPRFARYYSRADAVKLAADAGFCDIRVHHRHGYSWTVVATRPPCRS